MLFAESVARLLLVIHTLLAAALVAVSTHLVVWMRGFPKRRYTRMQGVRKLASISAALFVLTYVVGNLLYPVYKVRARAEYLDHPTALVRDHRNRQHARDQVAERYRDSLDNPNRSSSRTATTDAPPMADAELSQLSQHVPREAAKIARWFDVKEHWVGFGMMLSLGCALLLFVWNPKRHGDAISSIVFLMATAAALTTWLGAIVGIVVSSYRAVGGL